MPERTTDAASTDWPPSLLAVPTYVVGKLGRVGQRLTHEAIAAQGLLLPHFSILTALDDFGPLAQHELADRIGAHASHLVRYVDELEARNAVRRERDPGDRRRQVVSLTSTGAKLLSQLRISIDEIQEQFLAPLTASERARLMKLLIRVVNHGDKSAAADHRAFDVDDY